MKKIKVLNLYCGIGGNRKLWNDDEIDVTAIELNPEIATIYQDFFQGDKVIIADAHKFLLEHYKEFDFIWSSPPCQTHTKLNLTLTVQERTKHCLRYIDMKLYQEIIFLKTYFKGIWVVENVKPYYEPLIKPYISGCHCFWSNFNISNYKDGGKKMSDVYNSNNTKWGFCIQDYKLKHRKDQILNNMVNPKLGLHVFNCAYKEKQVTLI